MGSFSIWHWLIVLVIVMMVFGTKKLKNIGTDLGSAVKGFKDGVRDASADTPPSEAGKQIAGENAAQKDAIDVQAKEKSST